MPSPTSGTPSAPCEGLFIMRSSVDGFRYATPSALAMPRMWYVKSALKWSASGRDSVRFPPCTMSSAKAGRSAYVTSKSERYRPCSCARPHGSPRHHAPPRVRYFTQVILLQIKQHGGLMDDNILCFFSISSGPNRWHCLHLHRLLHLTSRPSKCQCGPFDWSFCQKCLYSVSSLRQILRRRPCSGT